MTERLLLTINYKNGNSIKQLVHNIAFAEGAIYYVVDKQVHDAVQFPVKTVLEYVESFTLDKVMCAGWKVVN